MCAVEVPKEQEKHLADGKTSSAKKAIPKNENDQTVPTPPWNLPEGDHTEVLDNEGHRNTLNKKPS